MSAQLYSRTKDCGETELKDKVVVCCLSLKKEGGKKQRKMEKRRCRERGSCVQEFADGSKRSAAENVTKGKSVGPGYNADRKGCVVPYLKVHYM